jgi:hypothetical protein
MIEVKGLATARSRRSVWAFRIHFEPAVDAGDHKVKSGQHVVRIVQRSVCQDVGFDPLQDPEVLSELLVEPVSFAVLLVDLLHGEAASVVRRF